MYLLILNWTPWSVRQPVNWCVSYFSCSLSPLKSVWHSQPTERSPMMRCLSLVWSLLFSIHNMESICRWIILTILFNYNNYNNYFSSRALCDTREHKYTSLSSKNCMTAVSWEQNYPDKYFIPTYSITFRCSFHIWLILAHIQEIFLAVSQHRRITAGVSPDV